MVYTLTLHAFRSKVRHAETVYKHTHSPQSWLSFKSLRNCYHNLILIAKKKFYSNLVSSSSTNPHHLWQTVNKLLHRKSTSPLPTSSSSMSLPHRFASFFTDKISKLHLKISKLHHIDCHKTHLRTALLHQFHLLISPLLGLHLNLSFKDLSFSVVPTSNVTPILSQPGSLKNVQFSFLQLPTSSICLSALVTSIPFSDNLSYLPF